MVLGLPLQVPTTRPITFTSIFESAEYASLVVDADRARALCKDSLKRAKDTNGDYFAVAKSVQEYLPAFFALQSAISSQLVTVKPNVQATSLDVAWSTSFRTLNPLAKSSIKAPLPPSKAISHDLDFDRAMMCLAYAIALLKLSESMVSELMSSATEPSDESSRKWKQATFHISTAMSILKYMETHGFTEPLANASKVKPLDLLPNVIGALHSLCWGCAHMIMVMRQYSSTKMSGMSNTLLSRVAVFAADKFAVAEQQLNATQDKRTIPVVKWLSDARNFCLALCHLTIAVENADNGKLGVAIGYLDSTLTHLPYSSSLKKGAPIASIKEASQSIYSFSTDLRQKCDRQNKSLAYETIVKRKDIEHVWPSGREVIPGTQEWTPRQETTTNHTGRQYY